MCQNAGKNSELPDETPLWRYMDVAKLMSLLVNHRVFIPTLATLMKDQDPKEALLNCFPGLHHLLSEPPEGTELRDWLDRQPAKRVSAHDGDGSVSLKREWLQELSCRRVVWCWASPKDSMSRTYESLAMWKSYAASGVAIRTTLRSLRNAIGSSPDIQDVEWVTIPVKYRHQEYAQIGWTEQGRLRRPFRPYEFKNLSYDYEHEVRIAFRVNGGLKRAGVVVTIHPHALLEGGDIVVSPYLPTHEADDLTSVVTQLLGAHDKITVSHCSEHKIRVSRSSERQTIPEEGRRLLHDSVGELLRQTQFADEPDIPILIREL